MDEATRQAVLAAAQAAGVHPDRAELVVQLVPRMALSRSQAGELDGYLLEVAVRGVAQMTPEWFQEASDPAQQSEPAAAPTPAPVASGPGAGPRPEDVDRLVARMRFACGFVDVPARSTP